MRGSGRVGAKELDGAGPSNGLDEAAAGGVITGTRRGAETSTGDGGRVGPKGAGGEPEEEAGEF